MGDTIFWVGKDMEGKLHKEYTTKEDADNYGGGCIGKRVVRASTFEPLEPVQPAFDKIESTVSLSDVPEEELRKMAKEKGVKSWHLLSVNKLIEALLPPVVGSTGDGTK